MPARPAAAAALMTTAAVVHSLQRSWGHGPRCRDARQHPHRRRSRHGLAVIDRRLAMGPVHPIKRARRMAVVLSEAEDARRLRAGCGLPLEREQLMLTGDRGFVAVERVRD